MTTCARYFGSDGTLCSTHNGRFASPTSNRCNSGSAGPLTEAGQKLRSLLDEFDYQQEVKFGGWDHLIVAIEREAQQRAGEDAPRRWPNSNLQDDDYGGHEGHEAYFKRGLCHHPSHDHQRAGDGLREAVDRFLVGYDTAIGFDVAAGVERLREAFR